MKMAITDSMGNNAVAAPMVIWYGGLHHSEHSAMKGILAEAETVILQCTLLGKDGGEGPAAKLPNHLLR